MKRPVKMSAIFFRTGTGKEPVREWLQKMSKERRTAIGVDIRTVQYGWPPGMPLVRKIESDLWEVRTSFPSGISRVFFTVDGKTIVLLHGFVKKSQQTPKNELDIARKRLAQYRKG